jgi:hypothetical protein
MTELEKSIMKVISLYFDDSTVYASEMHSQIMDAISIVPMDIEDEYVQTYLWERALIAIDDPCERSHPHENMGNYCQHKTELAQRQAKLREKNT